VHYHAGDGAGGKDGGVRTFKCDFGNGVACEVQVADALPEKGKHHIQKFVWSGKPTREVIQPYIAWMNSVNQLLADEWGVVLMHVFQTSPKWQEWETWTYAPNKQPQRVQ
jgi:hypothetical protein